MFILGIRGLCVLSAFLFVHSATAQDAVEAFYRGKTVSITVGSAVGGGFDAYARLVGRHLGRHVPGNPVIIVQNIPGAGSNRAATYVANQAPKDGTAIGAVQPTALMWPLISDQALPHDPSKLIVIGSVNRSVFLCLTRSDAPIASFKEAFTKEVVIGGSTEGATLRDYPLLLINALGVKFRLVAGYTGSREIILALQRNEVQGMCGMDWSSLATQQRDWLTSGFVRLLAQEDLDGHPEMNRMGVPLTISFARNEDERLVMEMIYSQNKFGRPYMLPAGVPPERVAALRAGFAATMKDKEFLAEAEKMGLDISPLGGEDLQNLLAKLYALPPRVIDMAKRSLTTRVPAK
jgi:tripartite-type tricarboxylate transporter receptor subunit TctC